MRNTNGGDGEQTHWVPAIDIPPITYAEALATLQETKRFGIDPRLESVEEMLAELGNPDLAFESLQIAGTNGKTSTSRYTAAILRGEGLHVALYTSPELVDITERMEIDGRSISQELFAYGISAARLAADRVNEVRTTAGERPYDITEFDLLTVGALVVFACEGVDVCVLECGMGGRWDATSACRSIRSVAITGIGLDHIHVLGDTLEAIAAEKAAIIKSGRSCVLGVGTATPDSVEDVFLERCCAQGVSPTLVRPENLSDVAGEMHPGIPRTHAKLPQATFCTTSHPSSLDEPLSLDVRTPRASYTALTALKPVYQAANIACATALAEAYLARPLDDVCLHEAIRACPVPGRFDVVRTSPLGLVDASHNPQSVETFLSAVRAIEPKVALRPTLLVATLADKDAAGIATLLAPEFERVVVTQTSSTRALPASDLAELFCQAGATVECVCQSVVEALDKLADEPFVACGSITLAGEIAAHFRAAHR